MSAGIVRADVHAADRLTGSAVISHTHRAIYVHIPKTGGQSIEQVFLDDLGQVHPSAALLLMPNPGPGCGPARLGHLRLAEYLRHHYVRPDQYEQYFKFSVVRNPWGRVISLYHYMPYYVGFRTFVVDVLFDHLWSTQHYFVAPQAEYLTPPDGFAGPDMVLRFERLADEFDAVRRRLGIETALPWVNQSAATPPEVNVRRRARVAREAARRRTPRLVRMAVGRKEHHEHPSDYFDDETASLVAERYAIDVEQFGYTFDQLSN